MSAPLTDVEQTLVDHIERGEVLDLAAGGPVDEPAMRSWDDAYRIRADVLRDVVRGRLSCDPDPRGLRLRGARITGHLDLCGVTSGLQLHLDSCLFEAGLDVTDARLSWLGLTRCRLEHPDGPALRADRLAATALRLVDSTLVGRHPGGTISLHGARIGSVDCSRAVLSNDSGPAVRADAMTVENDLVLAAAVATGAGPHGAVRLTGAQIGGGLDCSGAVLRNDTGPALSADVLQVVQAVVLSDGFTATGGGEQGAVRLPYSTIGGLDCSGAVLRNDTGPALNAFLLTSRLAVALCDGFSATGSGAHGSVWLGGARIGGDLDLSDAELRNHTGPALSARRLHVEHDVFLDRGFAATGSGPDGAVRLVGVRIGGNMSCSGAVLRNDTGPAMRTFRLRVEQSLFLDDGFQAVGGGDEGRPATLDLTELTVGGGLVLDPARLEHAVDPQQRLRLDGLTYTGLPTGITLTAWLELLRDATPAYSAQPYQQLAAAHRAAGHDAEVRRILIAQRRDQLERRVLTGRGERAWARLTGFTLGYGYQPWRALLLLLVTLAAAIAVTHVLADRGALTRVGPGAGATAIGTVVPCSAAEQVGVGIDLGLPLIKTGARSRCDTTDNGAGQALTVLGWILQLLAWALATLFVAGFTNAVRKT